MKRGKKRSNNDSYTKLNPKQHAQLLDNILSLNKKPQLEKPSRTEPTTQISEFNLVKSVRGRQGAVNVGDLTKVLKKRASHAQIGKKLQRAGQKAKTLPKPLEKPQAQRIRRSAGFESVKKELERWDAVVTSNRADNHLSFPLLADTKLESSKNFSGFRLKTNLQQKLEALKPKVEVFNLEKESEYPLTMREMLERRKETAKMRAVQSYKEAKARRQGKIKSKKFHRVQRQERIKKQMKDFEELQKTNPEEALKKLEQIERVRAEERATLRHRSTGQWAKSKQVRAKYDKESRQVLAQQLQVSRELTQKVKPVNLDSESEEEAINNPTVPKSSENNPWTNPAKTSAEVESFVSGYRKFWETENQKNVAQVQNADGANNVKPSKIVDKMDHTNNEEKQEVSIVQSPNLKHNNEQAIMIKNKPEKSKKKTEKLLNRNCNEKMPTVNDTQTQASPNTKSCKARKDKLNTEFIATSDWAVSVLSDDSYEDIDEIFDNFGDKVQKRLQEKYKKIKSDMKHNQNPQKHKQQKVGKKDHPKKQKNNIDLSFPQSARRPIIDEELLEGVEAEFRTSSAILETVMKNSSIPNETDKKKTAAPNNIDPDNIIKTKAVNLNTDIPDLLELGENEEGADQRGTVLEAFEDDDILEEFQKDKQNEIKGEQPSDINLALPGWGSWGGTGIKLSKPKTRRFMVRFPKQFKRRDENKGHLIISEKANAKIKPHLVSELPFPFKSVKDFEASIRAPVGNTFVPETAFRKMIRPAVATKLGTVIDPMTDDILLKKKK